MVRPCTSPRVPVAHLAPRFVLQVRVDRALLRGSLVACALFGAFQARAATLLSSAEQAVTSFQPAASGLFSPPQGRMGPVAQPSGQTIGSASIIAQPLPGPANAEGENGEAAPSAGMAAAKKQPRSGGHKARPEVQAAESNGSKPTAAPLDQSDFKGQALVTTAKDIFNIEFGWGWYNEYYFRGVNILKAVSSERTTSGVFTAHAVAAYIRPDDAFTVGFNYWQSLGRQQPKGGEFQVPPNSDQKSGRHFALPPRDRYAEYNFNLAYTRTLIANQLTGTIGFNRYQFSNGTFYETGSSRAITYADESILKLAYIGQKYVTPSLSWAHDYDGFKGDFLELRVDGNYALPARGSVTTSIRPYVSLSYDLDYNGANNGWNSIEFGADLPVQLTNSLTLTFSANYVQALQDSEGETRAKDGFWGGVSLSASWGGPVHNLPTAANYDKDAKKVIFDPDVTKKWEFSAGADYRQVDFGFSHGRLPTFPVTNLFTERVNAGDIGFARPGLSRVYADGAVNGNGTTISPTGGAGVAPAIIPGGISQIVGAPGANGYVRFSSFRYDYSARDNTFSPLADDEDAAVGPYIKLDRELVRKETWSLRAGVGYGFLSSTGDSGYRLDRLDTLIERRDRYGFDYSLDNVTFAAFGTQGFDSQRQLVVIDANAYATSLAATGAITGNTVNFVRSLHPLAEQDTTQSEVVAVATFVRTSLDISSHELSIPISLRKDLGSRLHAQLTVAPTLSVVDSELKTELSQRSLNELDDPKTHVFARSQLPNGTIVFGGGGNPIVQPKPTALPPPPPAAVVEVKNVAAGKGVTPQDPDFPGRDVGDKRLVRNSIEALWGVKTQASLIFDLNDEKTIYAELWGGYEWVQELHVSNGLGEGTLDLGGFQAGLGLGVRF